MKNMFKMSAIAVATVLSASVAMALPTGELQVGDKIFADFAVTGVDASSVTVVTIGDGTPGNEYGIQINGPFFSYGGTAVDYSFRYTVRTSSGEPLICAIGQSFNLTGFGFVGIGETVFANGFGIGQPVAQSTVSYNFGVGDISDPEGEVLSGDQLIINPSLNKVYVTKDILLVSPKGEIQVDNQEPRTGFVGATTLFQRFTQCSVPDGGSMLILFGSALSLLGLIKSRIA